jgi:predicted permease
MTNWWEDIRYAGRRLTRERGFTVIAAATLALGIAATTSLIAIVDAVLVRGLPVADAERIVTITMRDPRNRQLGMNYPDFDDWQRAARSFSAMTLLLPAAFSVSDEDHLPEQYFGPFTSANLFKVIGQRPVLGRDFTADDDRPGAPPVVILGYGLWQSRYRGDPSIVGRTLRISGLRPTVIGVMGPDMRFPPNSDLWIPLGQTNTPRIEGRDGRSFTLIARLTNGVSLSQARTELAALAAETARQHPQSNKDLVPEVLTYREWANGPQAPQTYGALLAAASFVLLIACVNVANLLLARSLHRTREVSLRIALGASRWRIVRQLLVESVTMAVIGGALSVPLVLLTVQVFDRMTRDTGRPYYVTYSVDPWVFAVTAAICLAVGIGFGLVPAWRSANTDVNAGIREGGTSSDSRRQHSWFGWITTVQVAAAVILSSGAGLLIRSVVHQYEFSLGLQTSRVIAMQLPLPGAKYRTSDDRLAFLKRVDEQLAVATGVEAASTTSHVPLGSGTAVELSIDGRQPDAGDRAPLVTMLAIGPRYFEALRLPLLRGRAFTDIDGTTGRDVAIVSQRLAEMYFPETDPIGHRIQLTQDASLRSLSGPPAAALTIIGVSRTIRQRNAREPEADPVVYVPRPAVWQTNRATVLVRTARSEAETTAALRQEIRALDPDMPVFNVRTLEADLASQRWPLIVIGTLFGAFAVIGLALSAVGLFALTSYAVERRMKEMALRITLGAAPAHVLRLLFGRVVAQVLFGLVLGAAGAYGFGRFLQGVLVQTSTTDPFVLTGVAIVLVSVAIGTCVLPARRALRVQPAPVLRGAE